jgi:hypothetical protein
MFMGVAQMYILSNFREVYVRHSEKEHRNEVKNKEPEEEYFLGARS